MHYVKRVAGLPKQGPQRLRFFLNYLDDDEELLARDAFIEFDRAPYSKVKAIRDQFGREWLLKRLDHPNRRLYLRMLGLVGQPQDVPMLERMMLQRVQTVNGSEPPPGLDAIIACYLMLRGAEGLPLIEKRYLADKNAHVVATYAAIMALRFHGQQEGVIPREQLLPGLRLILYRPELADLVIHDLARWEDWSVIDRLVELFKTPVKNPNDAWVRAPVIMYLRSCPNPRAEQLIKELAEIDPQAVRRASIFSPPKPLPAPAAAP